MSTVTTLSLTTLLALSLTACDSKADDTAGTIIDTVEDQDGDGYDTDTDCDDSDGAVHPGAEEICDGVDNNCDGAVDEGVLSTWYPDADADGFGVGEGAIEACEGGSGYVQNDVDCDDHDGGVYPNADEVCDGADNNCDGTIDEGVTVTAYADLDGDGYGDLGQVIQACEIPSGYVEDDTDCDDTTATVYPGATEICDELDNNCDGDTDEGVTNTWYQDADSDGYGVDGVTAEACTLPTGYAAVGGDCDDANPDASPDGIEVCDGADNDCDGDTDEPDALDATTWYADSDADGYGAPAHRVVQCDQPSDYVDNPSDCDDTDATINPDADEVCDGVDNDCDGSTDEADALDTSTWYADADGDSYGDATSTTDACDAPSGYVSDDTDCDDTDSSTYPGAPETSDGVDNDCDGTIDNDTDAYDDDGDGYSEDDGDCDDDDASVSPDETEICNDGLDNDCDGTSNRCALDGSMDASAVDAKLTGESSKDYAGFSLSSAGDVNADGVDDVLVGAYNDDDGGSNAGAAYLLFGPVSSMSLSGADAKFEGEDANDAAGYATGGAGDVDGDGYDDVLVGARYDDDGGSNAGAAYLVLGPVSGSFDLWGADAKLTGESSGDSAGVALAGAGDVDGDGLMDLLVGAYYDDDGATNAGAAYLVLGGVSGSVSLWDAEAKFTGESASDYAGWAIDAAGDLDADGFDDILIGAYYDDDGGSQAGAAYIVNGPTSGAVGLASADAKLYGEDANDWLGYSVSHAGDVDNDGYDDIIIGAPYDDDGGSAAGAAYLVLGPISGTSDIWSADAKLYGESASDYAGCDVAGLGDVDGDGNDDVIIGAYGHDSGGSAAGAAYVVYGPITGLNDLGSVDLRVVGESASDRLGSTVSGAGDTNADGHDDILMGAFYDDDGASNAGAAYLLLGEGI